MGVVFDIARPNGLGSRDPPIAKVSARDNFSSELRTHLAFQLRDGFPLRPFRLRIGIAVEPRDSLAFLVEVCSPLQKCVVANHPLFRHWFFGNCTGTSLHGAGKPKMCARTRGPIACVVDPTYYLFVRKLANGRLLFSALGLSNVPWE